jgi:hypothetical protein
MVARNLSPRWWETAAKKRSGVLVARPQQDHLQVPAQDPLHGVGHHVEPLLRGQPADHAEQRHVRVHGQPIWRCSSALQAALPVHVLGVEHLRQGAVDGRVPLLDVDAVQDAAQVAAAPRQHPVQAEAEGRGLDLPRVGGAHRRQHGAVDDGRLHQVEVAEVLELVRVVVLGPERGDEHAARIEVPLVGRGCGW